MAALERVAESPRRENPLDPGISTFCSGCRRNGVDALVFLAAYTRAGRAKTSVPALERRAVRLVFPNYVGPEFHVDARRHACRPRYPGWTFPKLRRSHPSRIQRRKQPL